MPARVLFAALLLLSACAPRAALSPAPPALVLGRFVDDYDNTFVVTPEAWVQQPHGRFHVVRWDPEAQSLVARNDTANAYAPGLWTRIDWVRLEGMAPYEWAFCLTAYEAPTRAAAEATPPADRAAPRTGCSGYPFSRMRRR